MADWKGVEHFYEIKIKNLENYLQNTLLINLKKIMREVSENTQIISNILKIQTTLVLFEMDLLFVLYYLCSIHWPFNRTSSSEKEKGHGGDV